MSSYPVESTGKSSHLATRRFALPLTSYTVPIGVDDGNDALVVAINNEIVIKSHDPTFYVDPTLGPGSHQEPIHVNAKFSSLSFLLSPHQLVRFTPSESSFPQPFSKLSKG